MVSILRSEFKHLIFVAVAGFLFWHFAATAVFCTPDKYFPEIANIYAKKYIDPAFSQGWNMFAPNPPLKERWMIYRWKKGNDWTPWHRSDTIFQDAFHNYRVFHPTKLQHLIQNTTFFLWGEVWKTPAPGFDEQGSLDYLEQTKGYEMSVHLAKMLIKDVHDEDMTDVGTIEIGLVLRDPFVQEGEKEIRISTYQFPQYHLLP